MKRCNRWSKGDISGALAKLDGDTVEVRDGSERLDKIVGRYRELGAERADTFVLTAGNAEKTKLNEAIRAVLREEGSLGGEQSARQLTRVFSSAADRKDAAFYKPGDQVRFGKDLKQLGVKNGDYLTVGKIDGEKGVVTLHRNDGSKDALQWSPRKVGGGTRNGVELFRPRDTSLAPGEKLRWTRNNKELGLTNGQVLTVGKISGGSAEFVTDKGKRVSVDTRRPEGQHWDHGYAGTVYSSQGGTAKHVLVNAESFRGDLFSQKAFLVAVSRQKESLTLYTDDREKLRTAVETNLGEKSSALEGRDAFKQQGVNSLLAKGGLDWVEKGSGQEKGEKAAQNAAEKAGELERSGGFER